MSNLDETTKKLNAAFKSAGEQAEIETQIEIIAGQIEALERQLAELEGHIEAHVLELGHKALELLRQGRINDPGLAALLPEISALEERSLALRDEIADKEQAIAELRANLELPPAPEPTTDSAPTPSSTEPLGPRVCPECSTELYEGVTYCTSCGAQLE